MDGGGDLFDVRRRRPAAAAHYIIESGAPPFGELRRERFGRFGETGGKQGIGEPGVGVNAHVDRREGGEFLD